MRRSGLGVTTFATVAVFCVCAVAWGQTQAPPFDLNFYGGGAKASAMGGAFIGVADDGFAAFWNPAGLTQNDRVFTGMQFRYQRQRTQNRLDASEPLVFLYDEFSRENTWNLAFASFNSPVRVKGQRFYLSASWGRAQDARLNSDYELTNFSVNDAAFFQESRHDRSPRLSMSRPESSIRHLDVRQAGTQAP